LFTNRRDVVLVKLDYRISRLPSEDSRMRATLVGHASLLVETSDLTILTDPTFGDSAIDGIAQFCPRRTLRPEALPPIDILYISHIHTDHFDIESLHALVENVDTIVTPNDPLILEAVHELGFASVQPVEDNQVIVVGETRLEITPSRFKVPEHGVVIGDKTGRMWNQVDTLSQREWIRNLHERGSIDVHFANFSPLSWYHVLVGGDSSFPLSVYRDQLDVIRAARAKLVIPASSGLSFREPFAFMNHYWFPLRHEQFAADIRSVMDCETAVTCPGDAVEVLEGTASVLRNARPELVTTTESSTDEMEFDPTYGIPPLVDDNPQAVSGRELAAAVERTLAAVDEALRSPAGRFMLDRLRPWRPRMRITVRFPDSTAHWSLDLGAASPRVRGGPGGSDNYFFTTTASGLHGVAHGLIWDRFFYFGYRAFHTVYSMRDEGVFAPATPEQGRLGSAGIPQPHELFFALWDPSPRPWIMRRVERALRDGRGCS
jgi:UDP-MurNAc hydroxylase